jgi:anthranilate synthase component 1
VGSVRGCVRIREVDWIDSLPSLHRLDPQRYPTLLESVAHGGDNGRYDILFACPLERISTPVGKPFLSILDRVWKRSQQEAGELDSSCPLPFTGGWSLYLGYEVAAEIEPVLHLPAPATTLPGAELTRHPAAIIRDHATRRTLLIAEEEHAACIELMRADLGLIGGAYRQQPLEIAAGWQEESSDRYLSAVERILDYIRAGDVFQVNLSREWLADLPTGIDAVDLYQRLCLCNPAPFAALATLHGGTILSSSPERLVERRGEWLQTRPIAGTRRRGSSSGEDGVLEAELCASPKEQAEHVMLIDLERNDLGRVCQPGTIAVDELMVVERYAHVQHIVSNIRGRVRPGITPGQIIAALFPGGTITGCPKVRCMEIIAELEGAGRGPYTGSIGYLNRDGSLDLNILIRTLAISQNRVRLRAGAGIVADSDPQRELDETRAKAHGLLLALASSTKED